MLIFRRVARDGREVSVVLNFTPVARENFPVAVPAEGTYREVFNSDALAFGGSGVTNEGDLVPTPVGERHILSLRIPPLGCSILQCTSPCTLSKPIKSHQRATTQTGEVRASLEGTVTK